MKAQSAIEYLISYGWMLIAVSIIGGGLYHYSSPGCNVEVSGVQGQDLRLEDAALTSDDRFNLAFRSSSNRNITVNQVEIGNGSLIQTKSLLLEPGETKVYEVAETNETEDCVTREIRIQYDIGPLNNQQFYGQVTAPAEFIDAVISLLDVGGGQISELKIDSTVKPENNDICIGDNCNLTTSETGSYVDRSGDTMTGALITERLEFTCMGDNCPSETGTLSGQVSNVNNTMDGTLYLSDISDLNGLTLSGYQ